MAGGQAKTPEEREAFWDDLHQRAEALRAEIRRDRPAGTAPGVAEQLRKMDERLDTIETGIMSVFAATGAPPEEIQPPRPDLRVLPGGLAG